MKVVRRADAVELQFTVPSTNTDGTRPANIERVDVYGFAGPDIKDEELVKQFRVEGFYERFPAKGQVERVARIHRELARVAGIERRGKTDDDDD